MGFEMNIKRNLLGIIFIPFCFGFSYAFLERVFALNVLSFSELVFMAGLLTYLPIHFKVIKPRFLATFGHEMTHAFWGIFFGAKIKELRVNKNSGFVKLTKSNFIIRLSPYFFPFFTFIVMSLTIFFKPGYFNLVLFFTGFTLALHIVSTLESLKNRQPDIYKTGLVFSLPIIYVSNLAVFVVVLDFVSAQKISLYMFISDGIHHTLQIFIV